MPYKENTYNLQDIGMWNIEGKDADGHIPENMLARWILASNDAGKAILIEDETEGTADSVWVGNVVDLNSVVVDVLTKQG
jgi:ribosomal silencing factor RsfS